MADQSDPQREEFDKEIRQIVPEAENRFPGSPVVQGAERSHPDRSGAAQMSVAEAEAELERLAGLSRYAFDREVEAAARRLRMDAGALIRFVSGIQQDWRRQGESWRVPGTITGSAQTNAPQIQPWPEPVPGADLLAALVAAIHRHLMISDDNALCVALWIMHSHALDAFEVSPRLVITSAEPASGKSTLLDLLAHLVPRPLQFSAATASAMLKSLNGQPALLIDDGNAFLAAGAELRNIIRIGQRRSTGQVLRVQNKELSRIPAWSAAALSISGKLPPALAGRSITIQLDRAPSGEVVCRLRNANTHQLAELHRQAARWAADNTDALRRAENAAESSVDENWTPLLLIASHAGPEWEQRAQAAMQVLRADVAPSVLETLLSDIRPILTSHSNGPPALKAPNGDCIMDRDRIRSVDLVRLLTEIEGGQWLEWGKNKQPLTAQAMAKLLAPERIRPAPLRFHSRDDNGREQVLVEKGYLHAQFADAFARYIPDAAAADVTGVTGGVTAPNQENQTNSAV